MMNQKKNNRNTRNPNVGNQKIRNQKNWIQRRRKRRRVPAVLWIPVFCTLCCGCGKKDNTLLIGESTENHIEQNGNLEEQAGKQEPGDAFAPEVETGTEEAMIRVYVCGAVTAPGVVEIPAGSRAEDALRAAGGFGMEAAREAVNLAEWVNDGQKLYFPAQGEEIPPEVSAEAGASTGLVNINTADAAALCTLPGVGESRAADIIAWREANDGFDSCEDIMKVPGIKDAMYQRIKDKIVVK